MAHIKLAEGTVPSTPGGSSRILFASSDGVYALDSAGGTTKFGAAGGGAAIGFSGSNGSFLASTVTFGNLNGVSFYTSNGSVVASYTDGGGGGGGIAAAAGTQTATSGTVIFANSNNFTFGMSGSSQITASFSESTHSHSTGPGAIAAGTQTGTSGTLVFSDSNGITFGMSGSTRITASHNGLTTQTVQTQSIIQGISAGTQVGRTGDIVFSDSNGISFGLSGSSRLTASYTVPSTAGLLSAIKVSAGTTSNNLSAITFDNSNGITFGLNASTLTASHNGLTTAAASNHSHGNPTLNLTNLSGTTASNSAGLTLSLSAAAQSVQPVAASGSNGSFAFSTLTFGNLNGLSFYTSNGSIVGSYTDGGGGGGGAGLSAGTQSVSTGTVVFANSNGVTWGMSGSSQITASYSQSTAPGAIAAGTQTATSGTIVFANSNGVTFGLSGSTQVTASHNGITSQSVQTQSNIQGIIVSNTTYLTGNVSFSNANGITFGSSAGQAITASHNALTSQSNQAFSAAGGSSAFQTLGFSDTNGVSFSNSGGSVVATVRTDYASSNHAHNATAFAASNTTQSSSGTFNISSMVFAGAGIASVGVTNGSIVVSVPSGGGAGDGGNVLAAGTRTATSLGTVLFSNANGVTFGLDAVNGSIMTASVGAGGGGVTVGGAEVFPLDAASVFSTAGLGTIYFQRWINQSNVSFNNIERRASFSSVSSTNSQVAAHTISYGLYSRQTGASSTQYSLIAASSMFMQASFSSNVSAAYTLSQGAASVTSSSAGTAILSALTGFKHFYLPFTNTITAGGEYAIAMWMSSATTGGTSPLRIGFKEMTNYTNLSVGKISPTGVSVTNASYVGEFAQGVYSSSSSNLPNTLALSGLTNMVSQARMYLQLDV
jgi:hypothetical protein